MPAINPRITITLEPSVHALLQRLSSLTKESQSSIVSDLLSQTAPVLERVITVLEAANAASSHLKTETAARLDAAQTKIEAQLGLVFGAVEDSLRPLLDEAEKVKRRARRPGGRAKAELASPPGRRAAPQLPAPMSNRGVTPLKRSKQTTAKKAAGSRK